MCFVVFIWDFAEDVFFPVLETHYLETYRREYVFFLIRMVVQKQIQAIDQNVEIMNDYENACHVWWHTIRYIYILY